MKLAWATMYDTAIFNNTYGLQEREDMISAYNAEIENTNTIYNGTIYTPKGTDDCE